MVHSFAVISEPTAPNMTSLPTPPSSSGDSPQPFYHVASPNSNPYSPESLSNGSFSQVPYTNSQFSLKIVPSATLNSNLPFLRFMEQPTNKFRFRYKSEMAGTHGSLCGINSDKTRKQTYPTVELVNCTEEAVIRCSIYQYEKEEDFKSHPHRLIMKKGREEFDDPHEIPVGPAEGFVATFHSMGIIHTARKNIVSELVRKKSQLKEEEIAAKEGIKRKLTQRELAEIKNLAESESKAINLNIVCLRFDAFIINNGIRNRICAPLYSHGINNLKCALTGDLKIVRMDHCTSPAKGGKEVFLLVERVTKKNIKVRLYELNDNDEEIWEGYGKFTELDVHHQYAIVFKTPPYRDANITQPVKVFMELVRPSDSARSESKIFRYTPCEYRPGMKRPRPTGNSYDSLSAYNSSGSYNSNEVPTTISQLAQPQSPQNMFKDDLSMVDCKSWSHELLGDIIAVPSFGSDEFNSLFEKFIPDMDIQDYNNKVDGARHISRRFNKMRINDRTDVAEPQMDTEGIVLPPGAPITAALLRVPPIKIEISESDQKQAERIYLELKNFIKSADAKQRAPIVLEHHLGLGDRNKPRNNALHVFIALDRREPVALILRMIRDCKKNDLVNVPNVDNLTPLHIAVQRHNVEFVSYLTNCGANPLCQNNQGQTVLHLAVRTFAPSQMWELLLSNKNFTPILLEVEDYEGNTPLNYAITEQNLLAIKTLLHYGADVNKKHLRDGFTPLRVALENQYLEAVQLILKHPSFDPHSQNDFQTISAFQAANSDARNKEIANVLNGYLLDHQITIVKKELEDDDEEDEEMDEEIQCKQEVMEPIENPESLYANLKSLSSNVLSKLAEILETSAKIHDLAQLLELSHLIQMKLVSSEPNISLNLLKHAIEIEKMDIYMIRNFLEALDAPEAVQLLDRAAQEAKHS